MLQEILSESGFVSRHASDDYWYEPRGLDTHAGVAVTPESALRFSTVFACVAKISKTIASLPIQVFERTGERETHAVDHPLNEILNWRGNKRSTGVSVRSSMSANRLLWGNGVSEITYTNGGEVAALTPLLSKDLRPTLSDSGELLWEHRPNNRLEAVLSPENYLHDPGPFVLDGVLGVTPIQSKETVAGGIAAQTFANTFFGNGAMPGGFLEFPVDIQLSEERQDQLVEKFNEMFRGAERSHKVGRLREGVTFNQIAMPLHDMQLLELRKFSRIEICSIFDVPPPMIQELDPGKYTAIEQAMIAWVRDSLLPICRASEAMYKRQFFPDSALYVRHNLAGLARGDMKARADFYKAGIQWGWFTINDVRDMEELNAVEGGDTNWIQMNMMDIVGGGQIVGPSSSEQDNSEKTRQPAIVVSTKAIEHRPAESSAAFGPLLEDVAGRIIAKEERNIKRIVKRLQNDHDAYIAWCEDFFPKHAEYVRKTIEPIICSLEQVNGRTTSERPAEFASRYAEHQLAAARNIPQGTELDAGYLLAELKTTYLTENIPCLT